MKITYAEIHDVVRCIPKGRVSTYGQVAELTGMAGQARRVGYALSSLPKNSDVPWHRVVNARGEISLRSDSGPDKRQMQLLRREGVVFDKNKRIPLDRFQWRPRM